LYYYYYDVSEQHRRPFLRLHCFLRVETTTTRCPAVALSGSWIFGGAYGSTQDRISDVIIIIIIIL
jgi:protein involved in ribonucleotide reduction